ncbi:MAG: hypothetical protein JW941_13580 [Candidatus Coatesbacteria bacterium]|nr:hypothetical protein [Candidatus Coatesbacteria bacterium]
MSSSVNYLALATVISVFFLSLLLAILLRRFRIASRSILWLGAISPMSLLFVEFPKGLSPIDSAFWMGITIRSFSSIMWPIVVGGFTVLLGTLLKMEKRMMMSPKLEDRLHGLLGRILNR